MDVPKTLETRLIAVGGLNRFGEPNFRVVWGPERLTWVGGEWAIYDENGNETGHVTEERQVQKYFPANRFYLEKWMPPEHYGFKEAWEANQIETVDGIRIPNLGPYPSRGEYELSMRFENKGKFAPIEGAESAIVELVQMIKRGEAISRTENWLAVKRADERSKEDWERYADAILDDTNVFDGKPHIYLPCLKPKNTIPLRDLKAIRFIDMGARVKSWREEMGVRVERTEEKRMPVDSVADTGAASPF